MGYKEKEIINEVLIEGSKKGRLFRVNCGMGWAGEMILKTKNKIILENPRPFHGMPAGTADIIGWESKKLCKIIPGNYKKYNCEKYGVICRNCPYSKKIAIFKAVEVKTGNQKLSKQQENFKKILLEHGGIYEEKRD